MIMTKCISIVLVGVFAVFSTTCLIIICCMKKAQATRHRAGAQMMLSKMLQGQTVSPQPIVYIGVHRVYMVRSAYTPYDDSIRT